MCLYTHDVFYSLTSGEIATLLDLTRYGLFRLGNTAHTHPRPPSLVLSDHCSVQRY